MVHSSLDSLERQMVQAGTFAALLSFSLLERMAPKVFEIHQMAGHHLGGFPQFSESVSSEHSGCFLLSLSSLPHTLFVFTHMHITHTHMQGKPHRYPWQ